VSLTELSIRRWPVLAAMVCSMLMAGWGARHRAPWSDEGWFSSPAYNLAYHGHMGTTVMDAQAPGLTRITERTYWVMPLFLAGQGLWYKVAPHTVLGTRAFSIIWTPLALWGLWALLRRLFPDTAVAPLACILLATSFVFMDNAGFGRPDLMCAALGLAGLGAYMELRERSLALALLAANACVAASGLTHPNGIYHLLALVCLALWLDRGRANWKAIGAAVLPYAAFGGVWSIYILQDQQAFMDQMILNGANGGNGRWTQTWNPALIIWEELRLRYAYAFGLATGGLSLLKVLALVAYLGAAALCLGSGELRRMDGVRKLLALTVVYFGAMAVFNQKLTYYLIHIVPMYAALLAVAVWWLWEKRPRWRMALAVGVVGLIGVEMTGIAAKAMTRSYIAAQRELVRYVREQARPGDLIIGTAALLYEMDFDPRLCDDPYLGTRSGRVPDVIIIENLYRPLYGAWRTERPEDFARIAARMAEYRKVRQIDEYEVYLRAERTGLEARTH
jgi:hypothetical protein